MPYKKLTQDTTLPQGFNSTFRDRFWSCVIQRPANECWIWGGTLDKNGYGIINRGNNTNAFAHRASWTLEHGDPGKLFVLHRCDTPACVNPAHLFLGSQADNLRDMREKGRGIKGRPTPRQHGRYTFTPPLHPEFSNAGEKHPLAILTADAVRDIRKRYANGGVTLAAIADEYGITKSAIRSAVRGKTWGHVK